MPMPLVTCLLPTRNRRLFVSQVVRYFLRQDYACRELLILDDGEDAVADLVPGDERIRYVRLDRTMSLGEKRNRGCQLSRGDVIAHWDDDDWIAPHRLRLQVGQLLASGADVCGLRDLLHLRLDAGEAWLYRAPPAESAWLAGCTLLYRRSAWEAHPFPPLNVGEDGAFVRQFPPERLHAMVDNSWYVALIHGGNTGAKNLADPCWQPRPLDEVSRLLGPDHAFYARLRNGGPEPVPERPGPAPVALVAPFLVYDGYGGMAEYMALGLARAGAAVEVVPLEMDPVGLAQEFLDLPRRPAPRPDSVVVYYSWPRPDLERFSVPGGLFVNTMWESSRLPTDWPGRLNRARAVLVPTRFVADVCRHSGVTVPIEVIPEGVDPAAYPYQERPERAGLTTLIVGVLTRRKHFREAVAAWKQAFADDPDARLIIKAKFGNGGYVPDDARIRLVNGEETTRGIAHWYRQADVLLALGNEGFGLPLVEGMATGLPVIALSSEGQGDVCSEAGEYLLPVEPAGWEEHDEPFGRCGVRGVPGVAAVAERLRWVAGHRDEARALGRAASAWALRHRNIWMKASRILSVIGYQVSADRR